MTATCITVSGLFVGRSMGSLKSANPTEDTGPETAPPGKAGD